MKIKIFKDKKEKIIGLSNKSSLDRNEAGLLMDTNVVTMKDTSFPLALVFIDKNNKITSIKDARPFDTKLYKDKSAQSVLEISPEIKDKFKVGSLINIDKLKKKKFERGGTLDKGFVLLDHKGRVQTKIELNELIISREETKKLTELASKAETEKDLFELGKLMYNIRMKQKARNS